MAGVIASLIIKGVITFALLTGAFLTGKEATKIIAPKLNPQPSPSPVLSETFGPSPSPTLAPKKTVKQPTPTVNSDPFVTCQFKYIPVRQMKLSECKKSTECQLVQGGEWFLYPSVEECKKVQQEYLASQRRIQESYKAPAILQPQEVPQKVQCVIGGKTYTYSSWELCNQARATFNRWVPEAPPSLTDYFSEKWQRETEQMFKEYQEELDKITESLPTGDYDTTSWKLEMERQLKEGLQSSPAPTPHYGSYWGGSKTSEQEQLWGDSLAP